MIGTPAGDRRRLHLRGVPGAVRVAASYNITYAPYVSDYSRYLPRDTKPSSIIASVFIGAFASPAWLIYPLGAWMATYLGASDALAGIDQTGNDVVPYLGAVLAIVSTLVLGGDNGPQRLQRHADSRHRGSTR